MTLVLRLSPEMSTNLLPMFERSWRVEALGTHKFSKAMGTNIYRPSKPVHFFIIIIILLPTAAAKRQPVGMFLLTAPCDILLKVRRI